MLSALLHETTLLNDLVGGHGFLALAIAAVCVTLVCRSRDSNLFPRDLPLVGEKPTTAKFGIKTRLAFYLRCSALYRQVWTKFSKRGLAVLVPTHGDRMDVVLPHQSIKWLASQPPDVLGMWEAFNDMFQLTHSYGDDKYMMDTWTVDAARRAMTQDLDTYIHPIREELELAIDSTLGMDTDNWTTFDLMDTMRSIVSQSSCRFTVGAPLCRDEGYRKASTSCIERTLAIAGIIAFLPAFLRPIAGRIAMWSSSKALGDLEARTSRMLEERFAHVAANPDDASGDSPDLAQRFIRLAPAIRPEEMNTPTMSLRVLMTNQGVFYQTGFAATNLVRSILESDAEHGTVDALRDEARRFAAAAGGDPARLWTRRNVARMVLADSAARETLRLYTVPTRALLRRVMVDGLRSDTGIPLPKGSLLSVVSQPMHTDPDHFPDPNAYDPFRFVKLREAADRAQTQTQTQTEKETEGDARLAPGQSWSEHAFLSTSKLLIFGRGRNTCPGRFLVDFQLKILMHHLLTNYDLKLADAAGERPTNKWMLELVFPPSGVKIMARRRTAEEVAAPA